MTVSFLKKLFTKGDYECKVIHTSSPYYLLGGCESGLADQYKSYVNDLRPEHSYTVGDGLFHLLKNLLETMPYDGLFTPPVEDHQLDKMTVMMLEMMGIKVEPKALVYYSANNQQEEEQGYGLWM